MSDISIPGISSRFDTQQIISDLVEVERTPIVRLENEIEQLETERGYWQTINRSMSALRDAARTLTGFENPFSERVASSSNERILTASAARTADLQDARITVDQVAAADRLLSRSLPRDFRVPAGTYTFSSGDASTSINYSGGSLGDFAQAVNRRASDILTARVVNNTSDTSVLVIEGAREGADFALQFTDDARRFALDAGILREAEDQTRAISLRNRDLQPLDAALDTGRVQADGTTLTVAPGGEVLVPIDPEVESGLELQFSVRLRELPQDEIPPPPDPPGPPATPGIEYRGLTVEGAPFALDLPAREAPEPVEPVFTESVLFARDGEASLALPDVQPGDDFQTVSLTAGELLNRIDALAVRNPNTSRTVEIRNVQVVDPSTRGDLEPANPISTAQNARLRVDGIPVERDTNTIDDVIPGVTLNLQRASDEDVDLTVEPNTDLIKESLINFVGRYNQVMREINILTRTNEQVVDEIEFFSEEEAVAARERLGALQGDSTLNQIRFRLQTLTQNAYTTDLGGQLALLDQIGISTNASQGGGGGALEPGRLRGYLEINETVLDQALARGVDPVRQLFGNDTNGDLVPDSGVSVAVDEFVRPFTQVGGLLTLRTDGISSDISQANDRIETLTERLERYEQQLRVEFGQMESSVSGLESGGSALENLPNIGSGDN